jgi:hypothetical protein
LERTPFLAFGDFDFWLSYKQAVFDMLRHDRDIILSNPTLSPAEKSRELETLQHTEANFFAIFDEAPIQASARARFATALLPVPHKPLS